MATLENSLLRPNLGVRRSIWEVTVAVWRPRMVAREHVRARSTLMNLSGTPTMQR